MKQILRSAFLSLAPDGACASGEAPCGKKPVLLAVSFGTSYNDNRDLTIGAVEQALARAYPQYEVRRAFTSQIIINKLRQRDGLKIDNVSDAMERLAAEGVTDVVVQSTHMMPGIEYDEMVRDVQRFRSAFRSLKIGKPVLSEAADFQALVRCLCEKTGSRADRDTAVVWMGHGTPHEANRTYSIMQKAFDDAGCIHQFVGTVEAVPTLEDMVEAVSKTGVRKVILQPMMIVAGDHANNDMAGDENGTWKSEFSRAGFQVECVLEGVGQYPGLQEILISHAGDAMKAI